MHIVLAETNKELREMPISSALACKGIYGCLYRFKECRSALKPPRSPNTPQVGGTPTAPKKNHSQKKPNRSLRSVRLMALKSKENKLPFTSNFLFQTFYCAEYSLLFNLRSVPSPLFQSGEWPVCISWSGFPR